MTISPAEILRPRLRGVLHTWATPVAVSLGLTLLLLANDARARVGTAVWSLTATGLFAVSATYHRGAWRPSVKTWLQRVDHSMIFVFIAGSYTPIALLLLEGSKSWIVLTVVWAGALGGVVTRLTWHSAPRWMFVPLYIGLGWVAVTVLPELARSAPSYANVLLFAGGVIYTLGAVVFATRRPDPLPSVFGYHEVFHALTILAASCHAVAIAAIVL
ncbi:MAG: hemolysin III family protein [Candidatus Nanopelagicales bacterium]